jgi:hypothetical protein
MNIATPAVTENKWVSARCSTEPVRCHSERSEESRSGAQGKLREGSRPEYFQGNARFFVAAPQNDSALGFFRSL